LFSYLLSRNFVDIALTQLGFNVCSSGMIRVHSALWLLMLAWVAIGACGDLTAAAQPFTYALLSGSDLTDDCLLCDRLSLPIPLQGTFDLLPLDSNPLFTRYQITNIAFRTIGTTGRTYEAKGGGLYRVGGEVALVQDLSLTLEINDGSAVASCTFTNVQSQVKSAWPEIQAGADQNNGTWVRLYRLKLVAAPVPQFRSVSVVGSSGSLRLAWQSYGGAVQVEKAAAAEGPYALVATNLTSQAFEDVGVLTNKPRYFYRLRQ
jgi:hypothetical protein